LRTQASRILGCVLIVLLALGFAVVTVGAGWIEDTAYRKNNWEIAEHTHWKTADQSFWQGYEIRWNYSDVINFTQWSFYMSTWGYGEGHSWFVKRVNLMQTVHAWGWGWIEGTKYSETIKQNVPGELTTEEITPQSKSLIQDLITFISGVWTSLKEIMPPSVQAIMSMIETLSDVAWTVIWLTFTIVSGLLPLLGVVIGFYFLNAGLRSLHEGSVEPLMKAAETFYNMFMGFANTAINMAKTIWSFVKFW